MSLLIRETSLNFRVQGLLGNFFLNTENYCIVFGNLFFSLKLTSKTIVYCAGFNYQHTNMSFKVARAVGVLLAGLCGKQLSNVDVYLCGTGSNVFNLPLTSADKLGGNSMSK